MTDNQKSETRVRGLPHIQFVFLELPKYEGGRDPQTLVDKWAYFFREAGNLLAIPDALRHPPVLDALEGARTARFSREEWDAYIAAGMAIQNERGALSLARSEGHREGHREGQARAILALLAARGIPVSDEARGRIEACRDSELLDHWIVRAATATSVGEVLAMPASA